MIANLTDAIKFMRSQDFTCLCVLGLSLGAAAAILTIANESVDYLITCSAVADTQKLFNARAPESIKMNNSIEAYEYDGWLIKSNFWKDAVKYDILKAFSTIKIPKLILQGDADDAPFVEGFKSLQRAANPPCDFYLFPGVGHTFKKSKDRTHLYKIVLRWLRTRLK
jgi:dipeptidyl aminopeptidase/acylaminoacyl peptidase